MALFGLKVGGKAVEKIGAIVDQTIIDKDKANELKANLVQTFAEHMLTGPGASITKYTICALVSVVVLTGTYVFLFRPPAYFQNFKEYALFSGTIIGMITGAYAAGTTVQTFTRKDKNG